MVPGFPALTLAACSLAGIAEVQSETAADPARSQPLPSRPRTRRDPAESRVVFLSDISESTNKRRPS